MTQFLLNDFIVEEHVKNALKEDIGYGDISTDFLCDNNQNLTLYLKARENGILCGTMPFVKVYEILKNVDVEFYLKDGEKFQKGDKIARISGFARSVLTGERLALNYIQKMSAIATLSAKYVEKTKGTKAKISDTRKSTPNFRMFEKYACLTGGVSLHRFNLCDCVMLKDNHIALCGGSIEKAFEKVRKYLSHTHKIEIECDTFNQVKQSADLHADIIMLDNMNKDTIKCSIDYIKTHSPNTVIEISGGVKLDNVEDFAKIGADIISTSAFSNAGSLDLGFDFID